MNSSYLDLANKNYYSTLKLETNMAEINKKIFLVSMNEVIHVEENCKRFFMLLVCF